MSNNICHFIPRFGNENEITILNFVHETNVQLKEKTRCESSYKIHLVTKGKGRLFIANKSFDLKCGDLFFTFPSMEYSIQSIENFEYMYISFIGIRTNRLMETLKISKNNFLFCGKKKLLPIWKESIVDDKSVLSLRCEGILLYSFSVLCEQFAQDYKKDSTLTASIKSYIDENFTDTDISLETISELFTYNKKYISTTFKKEFHIGIAQYITTLRIQYACTLMKYGLSSVNDIAHQCGFSEAQYFSRVFKNKMGISPKEHMRTLLK